MINERIKLRVNELEEQLIKLRRKLHMYPEMAMQEVMTTNIIAEELDRLNIPYIRTNPTGIIATITSKKPGKTIALRADIDALPVTELNDVDYKSVHEGYCHACGHDCHAATLLIAAEVLNELKEEISGTIRLIFQPAEEIVSGAKMMIAQGAMDGVDYVFGTHVWSQMPSGTISCEPGARFAAGDHFKLTFNGKAGHGALPHETVDATIMACTMVMNAQTIVSRSIDPLHSAVVTIGEVKSGTRFNVISGEATLSGTVRTFDENDRQLIYKKIGDMANDIATMYGGSVAEYNYVFGSDIVINDVKAASNVKRLVCDLFSEEAYHIEPPTCGGEDFGAYSKLVPGTFAMIGVGNKEKDSCWSHHHGRFNVDEEALKNASILYAAVAIDYLNN